MLAKGNEQPAASKNGTEDSGVELSKEEAEVYDRQIRVWGFEAQQKWEAFMTSGLLCGLSGVGAEIAKNLMLCGLRSLTLMDGQTVVEDDLESNFLLERDSVGQNALNPMVKLEVCVSCLPFAFSLTTWVMLQVLESDLNNVEADFVSRFTVVVLCDQSYDDVLLWNERCRKQNVGYVSADKHKLQYPRFEEAFNVDWSKKQLIRKSKRLIPCSYFPLKGMRSLLSSRQKLGGATQVTHLFGIL
ncbi:unnamed protein product [Heligmosomoides polygyrus]|uniref:ThiF domain-containing protein n=1 Tax=Heligmosomoides polygyrus TaxID=6339 RepID=A0A183G9A1_HELPZ|nr:unnamed protein product [Heligmosomoides polygyrus]